MFSKRIYLNLARGCKLRNEFRMFASDNKQETASKTRDHRPHEKTINQVTLLGRVGSEPLQKGSSEHPVVVFSLATHNTYKYENGEFTEKTDWHRVCVFKPPLRDLAFTYLHKGMRIHVSGKITYGTVSDGEVTKAMTSIIADDIVFLHHDGNS